jgi:YHS domain-containing protein
MNRLPFAVLVLLFAAASCGRARAPAEPHADAGLAAAPAALSRELTRVTDARLTCMAIDRAFDEPQRAVVAEGRTYYACCDDCRERLEGDSALRSAVDPVSKRAVDKASAVLARDAEGTLHYFESEATLAAYLRR